MNHQQPKVSVITVCYNAAKEIEPTLVNVGGQSYPNIEHIIVDGASKDDTMAIVERYRDKIAIVSSERDKGIYDAMNKGLDLATGDYVCFMNAGDQFYSLDALEAAMNGSNDADLVYGLTRIVSPEGEERPWHKITPSADKLNARSFMSGMVVCHQAMILKRSCAQRYDLQWKIAADIDWCIRSMQQVKTKHFYEAKPLVRFLFGGASNEHRKRAVKERFNISVRAFGLLATLLQQFSIIGDVIRRRGRLT